MTTTKKIVYKVFLILIVLLQLGRMLYNFTCLKENYYVDELWSYGLSNSYYEPYICVSHDQKENININQWFSSKVIIDYLTVDESERFSYGSVYYNQVCDYHPPLYYFILHTICSFFPGEFSFWFGLMINIIAAFITEFYLYKTVMLISDSKNSAILACFLYSFSPGCLNTFIFIRMYALLTAFTAGLLYYHARVYKLKEIKRNVFTLFLFTLLGALTHHFFVFFAGVISLCFCVYYLIKKQYKVLLVYSITMLSAATISLLTFPATITHLFSGRINDVKYPLSWQIAMTINCVAGELFGFNIPVCPNISYGAVGIVLLCSVVIVSPLLFLLRKEKWFINTLSKIKKITLSIPGKIKGWNLIMVSMILSSIGIVLLTAFTVSFVVMGEQTDRYLFMIYPQVCIIFIIEAEKLISYFSKIKRASIVVLSLLCCVFCFKANLYSECKYLFKGTNDTISASDYVKDADCIFISLYHSTLTNVCDVLMNADYIYSATADDLAMKLRKLPESPSSKGELFFMVESRAFRTDESEEYRNDQDTEGYSEDSEDGAEKLLSKEEFVKILESQNKQVDYIGFDTVGTKEFYLFVTQK